MSRYTKIKGEMLRLRLLINLCFPLIFLFISNTNLSAQTEQIILPLVENRTYEIKGGETNVFTLKINQNETAQIEIEQLGIDISLVAINPTGERFIETLSPSGLFGDELILVTAKETGDYKILVSPANPRSPKGKYKISLIKIRPTIEEDFQINDAAKKILKLAEEATFVRTKGTIEARREAIAKWQEIIELSKIKKDRVWEGIGFLTSGLIYEQLGELQNALDVYTKSLEIWQEIGNRQYEGSAVNNLGVIYSDLGEYEKAISNYNRAISIQREIGNRTSVGIYLNNLAYLYVSQKNYDEAIKLFNESLEIKKEDETPRGQRSVAITLNNLGKALTLNNDYEKGIKFLQESLELRRKIDDRWGIANSLLNLGESQFRTGNDEESLKNIEEANVRSIELGDRRMEAESLYLLATINKNSNDLDKATSNVNKGLEIIEDIRHKLIGSEVRYAYFSTVQNFYDLYVDILISQFEQTKDKQFIPQALEVSERSRSRSLIELLEKANVKFKQGVDTNLTEKLTSLHIQLDEKYNSRQRLLSEQSISEELSKINSEIENLNEEVEETRISLRKTNPNFADLTEGKTISAKEIQYLLDDETVLLEYKLGENRSFLWKVTNKSIDVFILPSRQQIENKTNSFYSLITKDNPNEKAILEKTSNELSNILFNQIKDEISNKRLVIVAESVLQYLPFSALPSLKNQANVLANEHEIVILPSASVLARIRENSNQTKTFDKTIAIFADPVFDNKDARIKQSNSTANPKFSVNPNFEQKLPRLLASRQEALNISNLVNQKNLQLLTDFEANIENLAEENLSEYRILHFATHGILDVSKPADSGLVLSLFDENGKEKNGFLSLDKIYNLNISSELVVLSACQTALGKDIRGEGLIGLSRGFLYAGSSQIVASLWKVDDFATAEFMKHFYHFHLEKNMPASSALQQAKLEMMKIPRYKSPFYWSAFTILGDWK